jgi:hypothetical protein
VGTVTSEGFGLGDPHPSLRIWEAVVKPQPPFLFSAASFSPLPVFLVTEQSSLLITELRFVANSLMGSP